MVPVELSGGPLDGHRNLLSKPEIDILNVHLFQQETAEGKLRCAYEWANRTTNKGRHWVLDFKCVVSRWIYAPKTEGGAE